MFLYCMDSIILIRMLYTKGRKQHEGMTDRHGELTVISAKGTSALSDESLVVGDKLNWIQSVLLMPLSYP